MVKCFFAEATTIEEFWRMTKIAAYRNNREEETDKAIKKPIADFYGILNKKFESLLFEELSDLEYKLDEKESKQIRRNFENIIANSF